MLRVWICVALTCVALAQLPKPDFGLLTDKEIHYINNIAKTTWKAGRNFHPSDHAHVRRLMGLADLRKSEDEVRQLPVKEFERKMKVTDLPTNFDPRTHWPNCPSLKEIRDQGNCGSCWAFGAVETMTDRICIQSKGTVHFHFSAEDLLGCCYTCGGGCTFGSNLQAWEYYKLQGIVSGGHYNSSQGCLPYQIPPCEHHTSGKLEPCVNMSMHTPECRRTCETGYSKTFAEDKHFSAGHYHVRGETNIMQELVTNGPIEAGFMVYSDFVAYKSGVYQHTTGQMIGGHAVKLMGYGEENGTKYWLLANSWNEDWGDAGFFKILRGTDECGIESQLITGEPKL